MISKKDKRIRRSKKTRILISKQEKKRLVVFRTNCHMYAQVYNEQNDKVIVSASTLQDKITKGGNIEAAKQVGSLIAKKALEHGVKEVVFDRSGFKYHGRIKALADSARENGLVF